MQTQEQNADPLKRSLKLKKPQYINYNLKGNIWVRKNVF